MSSAYDPARTTATARNLNGVPDISEAAACEGDINVIISASFSAAIIETIFPSS